MAPLESLRPFKLKLGFIKAGEVVSKHGKGVIYDPIVMNADKKSYTSGLSVEDCKAVAENWNNSWHKYQMIPGK